MAYVAGFETAASLAAAINPGHYERGWHATATFGTFGAAVAAGSIFGLDESAVAAALNLAASMPAGLKRKFGSMAKPMHVGAAVRSGVTASLLAAEEFSTVDDAIAGPGGFLDLYGAEGSEGDGPIGEPASGETILEAGIDMKKKYSCCYFIHVPIEGASRLVREHDISHTDVASVVVTASRGAGDALGYRDPSTGFEARFSMEFTVANAIVHGDVGPWAFEDERLSDPAVAHSKNRSRSRSMPHYPIRPTNRP